MKKSKTTLKRITAVLTVTIMLLCGCNSGDKNPASIYAKIQKLYSTDLPFVSLFYEKKALVMRNTIAGDVLSQQGFVYNNLPNWYTEVK